MKGMFKLIKPLCFIFLLLTAVVQVYPYINAVGCDFKYELKSEHTYESGKCNFGVLTSTYRNDVTKEMHYSKYLIGIASKKLHYILLSRSELMPSTSSFHTEQCTTTHMPSLYNDDMMSISNYKCNGQLCYIYFDSEIENVYTLKYRGRLSIMAALNESPL